MNNINEIYFDIIDHKIKYYICLRHKTITFCAISSIVNILDTTYENYVSILKKYNAISDDTEEKNEEKNEEEESKKKENQNSLSKLNYYHDELYHFKEKINAQKAIVELEPYLIMQKLCQ